jgi:hypothetical protein
VTFPSTSLTKPQHRSAKRAARRASLVSIRASSPGMSRSETGAIPGSSRLRSGTASDTSRTGLEDAMVRPPGSAPGWRSGSAGRRA